MSKTLSTFMAFAGSLLVIALRAAAQPDNGSVTHTGQATYYAATGDGNCMFGPSPGDLMVAAMNDPEYAVASVCGASVHVKGPKGEVTVRIVDRCPECPKGNLDLSKEAFMKIADTLQGRVAITWNYCETAVTGPIKYRIKTGGNQWWIGIQVLNHRNPVTKFEALKRGVWTVVPRKDYNYFIDSTGLGAGPLAFRVTDFYNEQLVDSGFPLRPDSIMDGHANFSSHAGVVRENSPHRMVPSSPHPRLVCLINNRSIQSLPCRGYAVYSLTGVLLGTTARPSALSGNGIFILRLRNGL
jgi:expansin (peptidoglycan-binding protein)